LLRIVNDRADGAPAVVLTDPGAVLGDQWSKVLDFWWYLDAMTGAAWEDASKVARAAAKAVARAAALENARAVAWKAAWEVASEIAEAAAFQASGAAAKAVAQATAWEVASEIAEAAAWEIQGAEIMRRDGKPFYFLPIFGFASPDDIPARPANYGPFTGE
jgi:hypothetical protein